MNSVTISDDQRVEAMPTWLVRELRSDHAGEAGAVEIYRGILAVCRDAATRDFALRHLKTERKHLALIEGVLQPRHRSRLLPGWKAAGWMTGALPALVGPGAVYSTICAVETFVDRHYSAQIAGLTTSGAWPDLCAILTRCRDDEIAHRDEAHAAIVGRSGVVAQAWAWLVDSGSTLAVALARRV